ncbi:MAG TPA: hypothetical protein VD930_06065 [Gemmatimonadales bacterium]|nr:hypothetical protein [Gemmatimonadales bacterium]
MNVREARLKAEFAEEYPGMTPGVWMPVRDLARLLVERVYARRREGRPARTFDPTHFEFRGGDTAPRRPATRTRSTDQGPSKRPVPPHRYPTRQQPGKPAE